MSVLEAFFYRLMHSHEIASAILYLAWRSCKWLKFSRPSFGPQDAIGQLRYLQSLVDSTADEDVQSKHAALAFK